MRLHSLRVVAFGPFVDAVTVDFDALNDAGLFLLTGATGAGKTSVLDAVCFALYGDVPGDRSVARRLRSDHAAPGAAPQVELEATLGGRRFRIVRSPAWVRPKKRGVGTTQQQASVTLTELVDEEWRLVSGRLDEVGDLVSGLLGMTLPQFCQVAMLPQGRFQAFLRARADERQAVLQQLFHTGRFARVEGWLREHRLALQRRSRRHHDEVVAVVNRLSEASTRATPDDWDLTALEAAAADGRLGAWAEQVVEEAETTLATCRQALPEATEAEEATRRALESAVRTHELLQRRTTATRAMEALRAGAAEHLAQIEELAAARRAAATLPLVRIAEHEAWEASAARVRAEAAWEALASHVALVPGLGSVLDEHAGPEAVRSLQESVGSRLADLVPLGDADQRALQLDATIGEATKELERLRERTAATTGRLVALPGEVDRLRAALKRNEESAAALPALQLEIESLELRLAAVAEAERLVVELDAAEQARAACREEKQERTEVWLDLREARLQGMAAEIAGSLAVGGSCPVCGSCSHPHPARPTPGAPDAAAEREARRAVDDAESVLHAHEEQVQQLRTRLEVARRTAGDLGADALAEQLDVARGRSTGAHDSRARAKELEASVEELEQQLTAEQDRLQELRVVESRLEVELQNRRTELAALRARLEEALTDTGLGSVTDLVRVLETTQRLAEEHLDLDARSREATERAAHREQALADCLSEHGFPTAAEVHRAARDDETCTQLDELVAEHRREEARWQGVLDDPELASLTSEPVPDLDLLREEHATCRRRVQELTARRDRADEVLRRLRSLADELSAALARWAPLRERLQVVGDLSAFVEGKSVDNRLQMRLSAYVLGYRLSQVVEAANLRLGTMSDGRYALEHTGERTRRETRGGLGLLVRDDWSGESRDPSTLSGGETFVVSLALALGLADVITEEAGGAELDTLFVDEGFGSLDADTLDDVLDTLDALRGGGRVVGVVSHVTEMRERIPTQLRVEKARSGSTLHLVTAT